MSTFGQRLKAARLRAGLTQSQLGELAGVQKSAISKYERDVIRDVTLTMAYRLSKALSIQLSDIWSAPEPESTAQTDFTGTASIGQRIFYRREWLLMSRSELALAAGLPDMESVEAIEADKTPLTPELVRRLTTGLQCTCEELVGCNVAEWSTFCRIWQSLNTK